MLIINYGTINMSSATNAPSSGGGGGGSVNFERKEVGAANAVFTGGASPTLICGIQGYTLEEGGDKFFNGNIYLKCDSAVSAGSYLCSDFFSQIGELSLVADGNGTTATSGQGVVGVGTVVASLTITEGVASLAVYSTLPANVRLTFTVIYSTVV